MVSSLNIYLKWQLNHVLITLTVFALNDMYISTITLNVLDDLVEKNQKEVTIHDLDALALTLLVDFAYTGEIVISEDNVQVCSISAFIFNKQIRAI